jgi:hypothetical protein
MGSSNSLPQDDKLWENDKKKANRIYNFRIQNYNYLIHGSRDFYMIQVEAEYELECIPKQYRSNTF